MWAGLAHLIALYRSWQQTFISRNQLIDLPQVFWNDLVDFVTFFIPLISAIINSVISVANRYLFRNGPVCHGSTLSRGGYAKKEWRTRQKPRQGEGEKAKRPHSSREKKIYHRWSREEKEKRCGYVTYRGREQFFHVILSLSLSPSLSRCNILSHAITLINTVLIRSLTAGLCVFSPHN